MTIIYLLIGVEILLVLLVSGYLMRKIYFTYILRKNSKNNSFKQKP